MSLAGLKKFNLTISWYLVVFFLAAMIPVGVIAYLSVQQADAIQAHALARSEQRARAELFLKIEQFGKELVDVADYLDDWDETLVLFRDATYYNYWKQNRAKDVARYHGRIDDVELFRPGGNSLTSDATLAPAVYPDAVGQPALWQQSNDVFIVYFHPITTPSGSESVLIGYVGVRMSVNKALRESRALERLAIRDLNWRLASNSPVPVGKAMKNIEIRVTPSDDIGAFSSLVRQSFMHYLGYTVGLLLLLGLLLSYSIARPLTRLAGYLREIKAGNTDPIPEDLYLVNIQELENVRHALNDYKNRLLTTAAKLEEKNKELLHLTYHDPLTNHFNRRAFEARLERAIETAVVEGKQHALCYIDVDQFKVVNDTCGHVAGDELLKQLGTLLESEIRHTDMLARLGGDEFGLLLDHCELENAAKLAEAIRLKVRRHRFVWQGRPFDISISTGLVPITAESVSLEEVMKNADAACYVAKDSGRNRVQIYQPHDKELAQRSGEMQWVSRLRQALEENRFELHGQLIRPTSGKASMLAYEVLVRLRDPDGQLVPPMAFIPAAERYNLMPSIDAWVVRRALDLLVEQRGNTPSRSIELSINLSGQSLGNEEILDLIQRTIEESGISPECLCFEITETAAITNLASAARFIHQLRRIGCRFALDDFGSGLSSFGYLSNLEVDYIKIDGHFVKNILTDPLSRSIVDAVNSIGHVMGINTIAEFVENQEIADTLKKIGVDFLQGYGVHKPEPLEGLLSVPRSVKNLHTG